jgi:hypothetical protein
MSAEALIGAATEAACAALDGLCRVRALPEVSVGMAPLPDLVAFYAHFLPLNDLWHSPIQAALPLLRGVRSSKGVRFSSYIANCHHEILLKIVQGLHGWLGRQAAFQPIALYLWDKCLGLFRTNAADWQLAVERFVLARCASDEQLAEAPRYQEPRFANCEAIYRRLISEETFDGRTFTQVVLASPPAAYFRLAKLLGKRATGYDLEELRRQIQWEASRALLINREMLLKTDSADHIRPEDRTRPMTLLEAARYMGYCRTRDEKAAVKALRAAVDSGVVAYERLTRKQHVFSRRDFPKEVWPRIAPIDPE